MDDAHKTGWLPDLGAENVGAVSALKQKQVAAQHQQTLGRQIDFSRQRVVREQQAAAVRCVGAHKTFGTEGKPRVGAALCAMAMHHVGVDLFDPAYHSREREKIGGAGVPPHRNAGQAER